VVRSQRHAAAYIAKYLGKAHIGHPWPATPADRPIPGLRPHHIGRLAKEWSARATPRVAAGHIRPATRTPGSLTSWFLLDADHPPGPPSPGLAGRPGHG